MMKIVIVLASSFDNEGELSENTYNDVYCVRRGNECIRRKRI